VAVLAFVAMGCVVSLEPVACFHLCPISNRPRSTIIVQMGLYDTPLPPRPPPEEPSENKDDQEDLDLPTTTTQRLFSFRPNGTEERDLLPRLSRSLTSGIGCYYEVTDRKVQNLVSKTDCHPEDAAWALEACQGDMTEAWTRISTARRLLLLQQEEARSPSEKAKSAQLAREELDTFKAKLKLQEQKRAREEYFTGGKADTPWLPRPNPKPIDDEPWFTG